MTRKKLLLAATAAAVMAAFNPAFAQDNRDLTVNTNPNVGISTADIESSPIDAAAAGGSVGMGVDSADQAVWSGLSADQSRGQDIDPLTGLDRAHPVN